MVYSGIIPVLNPFSKVVCTDVILNSGYSMPVLGFGTYTIKGNYEVLYKALDTALEHGYRLIDTATVYGNEEDIGRALKELLPKHNLSRESVFITSKLAPADQGHEKVKGAVEKSLKNLGTEYIDLYLIHWPGVGRVAADKKENEIIRAESWTGLTELINEGKLKSAGVSNYTARHIRQLLKSSSTPPAVNQVEYHPHWQQNAELFDISAEVGTIIQSYSTLGGNFSKDLLSDSNVVFIANKMSLQPAQVLLRWSLQHGAGIIPKSVNPDRIIANTKLDFVLSKEDMEKLDGIGTVKKYAWNPDTVE